MIQAVLDKVIVQPVDGSGNDDSGFIMQEDTTAKVKRGVVLSVGPGPRDMTDKELFSVKVGDTVLYPASLGLRYMDGDQEVLFLTENEVLGVVRE